MATRAEMRTSLRIRLEDTGGSPLWSDGDLNDFLGEALQLYGRLNPPRAKTTVAVGAGATVIAAPAGVEPLLVVNVRDATGADVLLMNGRQGFGPARMVYTEQAWRAGAGELVLERAVAADEAGNWTIEYLGSRSLPGADGTAMPIEAGDEPVVLQLAEAGALRRRLTEDYKRGSESIDPELPRRVRDGAIDAYRQSRRRARGSYLARVG
jgi:hypothetical protein